MEEAVQGVFGSAGLGKAPGDFDGSGTFQERDLQTQSFELCSGTKTAKLDVAGWGGRESLGDKEHWVGASGL